MCFCGELYWGDQPTSTCRGQARFGPAAAEKEKEEGNRSEAKSLQVGRRFHKLHKPQMAPKSANNPAMNLCYCPDWSRARDAFLGFCFLEGFQFRILRYFILCFIARCITIRTKSSRDQYLDSKYFVPPPNLENWRMQTLSHLIQDSK